MPTALRSLDDKVLGDRGRRREAVRPHEGDDPYPEERRTVTEERAPRGTGPTGSTGDGLKQFLAVFARVSKAVLLLLALVVVLGIVFVLAPTNGDNVIVRNVLDLAETVAGPFKDVFTAESADREKVVNYALAAGVYALAGVLVGKLARTTA